PRHRPRVRDRTGWWSSVLLAVQVTLQRVEVAGPPVEVGLQPFVELLERSRCEVVDALLRGDPAGDEAGVPEHLQVLGDRRLCDGERVDQGADAVLLDPQPIEDAPTGG